MKKLLIAIAFLISGIAANAEVKFEPLTNWDKAKENARVQNKLIFIDCYTDWCSWCKVMDKKTFSTQNVGELMNKHFINYKLEMEKTELGPQVGMAFCITGYPSYLIFNNEGQLLTKISGYQEVEEWMKTIVPFTTGEKTQPMKGYQDAMNVKFPEFYVESFKKSKDKKEFSENDFNNYLNSMNNWMTVDVANCIFRFTHRLNDENADKVIAQKSNFTESFGAEAADELVWNVISSQLSKAAKAKNLKRGEAIFEKNNEFLNSNPKQTNNLKVNFYSQLKEYGLANELIMKLAPKQEISYSLINSIAWNIYESPSEAELTQQAINWMRIVVQFEPSYAYQDTYAALLYKSGNKAEALDAAKKALEYAKSEEEDAAGTLELIKKIEGSSATPAKSSSPKSNSGKAAPAKGSKPAKK